MRERFAVFISLLSLITVTTVLIQPIPQPVEWNAPPGLIHHFQFSPNDELFAVTLTQPSDNVHFQLIVIDRLTGELQLKVTGLYPENVCFDSAGKHVAVIWADGICVYSLHDRECLRLVDYKQNDGQAFPYAYGQYAMAFTDDGKEIVVVDERYTMPSVESAWDIRTGEQIEEYGSVSKWVGHGIAFDRSKWYSGGWPGPTPRVFDNNDGHRITYCFRHPYHIFGSFTRDSNHLLTVHEDGALFVWELCDTGNSNAKTLHAELKTGLDNSLSFAMLNRSDTLAYIDSNRDLKYKQLLVPR